MPKTLVVDDDPNFEAFCREYSVRFSTQETYEFLFAHNDEDAVHLLKTVQDLDIAVVAINSRHISGMNIFQHLGDVLIRIPRVALTDGSDLLNIRRAMNDGAVDFLIKPVTFDDLKNTLHKVFQECERRRHAWRTEAQLSAIRKEIAIAGDIQKRILPSVFPNRDDLEIHARTVPSKEMGGDFYDFIDMGARRLGLVIADVSGKGIPAAFFMAISQTTLRTTALTGASPGMCLQHVNFLLCRHNIPGMLVSIFFGVLDLNSWQLTYANAGHPPPYLISGANGDVTPLSEGGGVIIGVQEGLPYAESQITMGPQDTIFGYTDGLTEAFDSNRKQFSEKRLERYLGPCLHRSAQETASDIYDVVSRFTAGAGQSDDITTIAVKRL